METLKEANPFNEDPQEGYEYMMSKISVKVRWKKKARAFVYTTDSLLSFRRQHSL